MPWVSLSLNVDQSRAERPRSQRRARYSEGPDRNVAHEFACLNDDTNKHVLHVLHCVLLPCRSTARQAKVVVLTVPTEGALQGERAAAICIRKRGGIVWTHRRIFSNDEFAEHSKRSDDDYSLLKSFSGSRYTSDGFLQLYSLADGSLPP